MPSKANKTGRLPLPVRDATSLPEPYRSLLRAGELMEDGDGRLRRLPRLFYEVESWEQAQEIRLAKHFRLWEFIGVDVQEAEPLRTFPRYVPCTVTALAAHLQLFRHAVGRTVHIAENGGYRSPSHERSKVASPHHWGAAANIYRVGRELLDNRESIDKFRKAAMDTVPSLWIRPYGHRAGSADDHLHLDIGFATLTPRGAEGESRDGERA